MSLNQWNHHQEPSIQEEPSIQVAMQATANLAKIRHNIYLIRFQLNSIVPEIEELEEMCRGTMENLVDSRVVYQNALTAAKMFREIRSKLKGTLKSSSSSSSNRGGNGGNDDNGDDVGLVQNCIKISIAVQTDDDAPPVVDDDVDGMEFLPATPPPPPLTKSDSGTDPMPAAEKRDASTCMHSGFGRGSDADEDNNDINIAMANHNFMNVNRLCPVCLDIFTAGSDLLLLPCCHWVCQTCSEWIARKCPLCREVSPTAIRHYMSGDNIAYIAVDLPTAPSAAAASSAAAPISVPDDTPEPSDMDDDDDDDDEFDESGDDDDDNNAQRTLPLSQRPRQQYVQQYVNEHYPTAMATAEAIRGSVRGSTRAPPPTTQPQSEDRLYNIDDEVDNLFRTMNRVANDLHNTLNGGGGGSIAGDSSVAGDGVDFNDINDADFTVRRPIRVSTSRRRTRATNASVISRGTNRTHVTIRNRRAR